VKVPGHHGRHELVATFPTIDDDWQTRATGAVRLIGEGPIGDATAVDAIVTVFDDSGWALRMRYEPHAAGPRLTEATLRPTGPASELGARLLRRLRMGAAVDQAETSMREYVTLTRLLGERWGKPVQRPGRRGRPLVEYAVWAHRYVEACERDARAPIKLLALEHGDSESSIRGLVNRARDRGLLTRSEQGKSGGKLTAKARRILADLGEDS
jgi:hypothetical protein